MYKFVISHQLSLNDCLAGAVSCLVLLFLLRLILPSLVFNLSAQLAPPGALMHHWTWLKMLVYDALLGFE
jgi:hypothetical protein